MNMKSSRSAEAKGGCRLAGVASLAVIFFIKQTLSTLCLKAGHPRGYDAALAPSLSTPKTQS
jgi:hypothetical protein